MGNKSWKSYSLEFFSIFIAVVSAFALNNWNENRRDHEAANKILVEISNGIQKDIEDVQVNMEGHKIAIKACDFWREVFMGKTPNTDTLIQYYFDVTRDYISIQNVSGYETLKSKGLELIENDSLRFKIINLYEYDYNVLQKFEEDYQEMQFHTSYFESLNRQIAPYLKFNSTGNLVGIDLPMKIDADDKNLLLSYLWKIHANRYFITGYYKETEKKLKKLKEEIEAELKK